MCCYNVHFYYWETWQRQRRSEPPIWVRIQIRIKGEDKENNDKHAPVFATTILSNPMGVTKKCHTTVSKMKKEIRTNS